MVTMLLTKLACSLPTVMKGSLMRIADYDTKKGMSDLKDGTIMLSTSPTVQTAGCHAAHFSTLSTRQDIWQKRSMDDFYPYVHAKQIYIYTPSLH